MTELRVNQGLMAPPVNAAPSVRALPWLLLAAGCRMFGGTMLVVWATAPGLGLAARGVIAAAGVVVVALGVRTLCEGVWIEHDGVLVRNVFRSWRLRWDEIAFVGPSEHWFSLSFTLHDGRRIPARGVGAITRAKRGRLATRIMAVRPRGA